MQELSRQQKARYDRIRATFNGPVTVDLLKENPGTDRFAVSLASLPSYFERQRCETDSTELATVLSSGLSNGWSFDATRGVFSFAVPPVREAPASATAPGVSTAEMAASLTAEDRSALRWKSDPELQRRFPSVAQYQQAVALDVA